MNDLSKGKQKDYEKHTREETREDEGREEERRQYEKIWDRHPKPIQNDYPGSQVEGSLVMVCQFSEYC